jgi:hypothetical protein
VRNQNKPTLGADLLACCWCCWLAAGRSAASWRLKKTEESKRDTEREGRREDSAGEARKKPSFSSKKYRWGYKCNFQKL